jgi:hypothetical protein
MRIIRVLNSAFKPGGLKYVVLFWLAATLSSIALGKFSGDMMLLWVGPIALTLCTIFILWLVM